MATTTVKSIIDKAKLILQETTPNGIRWTNEELLGWLNEAYQKIIGFKPNANGINEELVCVAGSKQSLPANGVVLLDVVRNLAGTMGVVTPADRSTLDATRRGWHQETQVDAVDHFMFDDQDPKNFYVYPPATVSAKLEIIYAAVPAPHPDSVLADTTTISLDDRYAPVLTDFILSRAYAKDADFASNSALSTKYENSALTALGIKVKSEAASSPNNPKNRQ